MQPPPPPPPAVVLTCRPAAEPAGREWSLVRRGTGESQRWQLVYRGRPGARPVPLPLPAAAPTFEGERVGLDFQSANGGRRVRIDAIPGGRSTLDVFVNFELEINVERDLDRGVDAMNTDGPLAASCVAGGPVADRRGDLWMAGAGYAWSVALFQSRAGRHYLGPTISWGRDVTGDVGPGLLRGRLMWAVEAMPLYYQHAPTTNAGVGMSPIVWRWRFVPGPRVAPFAELAFGGLFTRNPVPENTVAANFLAHGAIGLRWHPGRRTSLVTAYRFQHVSNGNRLRRNPGVNAHVLWLGLALTRR